MSDKIACCLLTVLILSLPVSVGFAQQEEQKEKPRGGFAVEEETLEEWGDEPADEPELEPSDERFLKSIKKETPGMETSLKVAAIVGHQTRWRRYNRFSLDYGTAILESSYRWLTMAAGLSLHCGEAEQTQDAVETKLSLQLSDLYCDIELATLTDSAVKPDTPRAKEFKVRAGQFRLPFGVQPQKYQQQVVGGRYSQSACLIVAEGYTEQNDFSLRDTSFYDTGLMFHGEMRGDIDIAFSYQLALLNGEGMNSTETDSHIALCSRIGFCISDSVTVGCSYYDGDHTIATGGRYERKRGGADLSVSLGPILFSSEYVMAYDNMKYTSPDEKKSEAAYLQLAYLLWQNRYIEVEGKEGKKGEKGLWLFGRWDSLNSPPHPALNGRRRIRYIYTAGVAFDLSRFARLQLTFEKHDFGWRYGSEQRDPQGARSFLCQLVIMGF